MKWISIATSYILTLAIVSAITPGHVGLLSWQVNNPSRDGVNEIEFAFSIANELEGAGWYLAMQFPFINREQSGIIGYCGIQPRGIGQAAALFSVFGAGTEIIDHDNCRNGADGGPGISCFVNMKQYAIKTKYYIQIRRDKCDPRIWSAVVTDKQGYVQRVGSWKVREGDGGINRFQMGFLEYYRGIASCESAPYIEATYYRPTTPGFDTQLNGIAESGKCVGKSGLTHIGNKEVAVLKAGTL